MERCPIRIDMAGTGALLLDCAHSSSFREDQQRLIWAVAHSAKAIPGVQECVPGMNNLMVVFDGRSASPAAIEQSLRNLWQNAMPSKTECKEWIIPVRYGGASGEDLPMAAGHASLTIEEFVGRHAAAAYSVAALGAMAGYPYLSGLDPRLSCPRRASPRLRVPAGAVIIGGSQAGIMPCTAPSGWHILGMTDFSLFDLSASPPARLNPGDTVRFTIASLET